MLFVFCEDRDYLYYFQEKFYFFALFPHWVGSVTI